MAKVTKDEMKQRRPQVTISDLEGGDTLALTCTKVTREVMEGKPKRFLQFKETGEKVLWINNSSTATLVDAYGDDDDLWVGKPVAIMRNEGEYNGKSYENLAVAPLELWAEIVTGSKLKPVHRTTPKKGAAAKR